MRQKLFISHASEDKESFVHPFALRLRDHFDIWYDNFSLKIGDSLRKSIDEGLRTCDYGVVVVSNNFFQKQWPQDELSALWAQSKVLPVWYKISKEEVERASPLLVDKVASIANSENDIPQIIQNLRNKLEGIKEGINIADKDIAMKTVENLIESIDAEKQNQKLLCMEEGIRTLEDDIKLLQKTLAVVLTSKKTSSGQQFFRQHQKNPNIICSHNNSRLLLSIHETHSNNCTNAFIKINFYQEMCTNLFDDFKRFHLSEEIWHPFITQNGTQWRKDKKSKSLISSQDLINKIIIDFSDYIDKTEPVSRY